MHQNSFQSIRKKAFRKACSKVYRTQDSVSYRRGELTPEFLRRSGLEPPPLPLLSGAPPLLRPHLLRSAPGPEEVRRANTFVSYPGMQGTWAYSSGQRYVHGFERTLVLSAMFWCFRKRTGMKQPNLMSRAGIASAQQKRAPPGRQRKKQLLGNARRRKLHRSKTPSWTRAERTE